MDNKDSRTTMDEVQAGISEVLAANGSMEFMEAVAKLNNTILRLPNSEIEFARYLFLSALISQLYLRMDSLEEVVKKILKLMERMTGYVEKKM